MSIEEFIRIHCTEIVAEKVNRPVEKRDSSRTRPAVDIEALLSSLQGNEANPIKIVFVSEVGADNDIVKQLEYDAIRYIAAGEYGIAIRILKDLL